METQSAWASEDGEGGGQRLRVAFRSHYRPPSRVGQGKGQVVRVMGMKEVGAEGIEG